MTYTLHHGDCLDILPALPAQSVDAIVADPPYGTTACKWDSVIPLEAMWHELNRVIKPRGAVVLFAAQPFTSALVMSNIKWFKYQWVWVKSRPSGFVHAKNKPLKIHEDVLVFSPGTTVHASQSDSRMTYNPQGLQRFEQYTYRPHRDERLTNGTVGSRPSHKKTLYQEFTGYPLSTLEFPNPNNGVVHPTQKPVELLRYLVRTYTNPGETVLDFTMGSGTTGVACAMEGRHFIGVELDAGYYDIARKRIDSVQPALMEAAD